MIVCPNCNHQNPDGAIQCEACYTPLPATTTCPNCGTSVQTDASFCGQCGFNLSVSTPLGEARTSAPSPLPDLPDLGTPDPEPNQTSSPDPKPSSPLPATVVSQPLNPEAENTIPPDLGTLPPSPVVPDPGTLPPSPPLAPEPVGSQPASSGAPPVSPVPSSPPPARVASSGTAKTQLQVQAAKLHHVQTNTPIELPPDLSVIHIGKPNEQIPPDIDVSGFPNSEIVSRIHADIRVEGDAYYIEDVGSSNGTYINHTPLPKGNRHRLRVGDRISLGKGDQVTFLFQNS
ncbi:MAG TPA: FHA domain-containing protein [Coleofasciculaceae cyanobacterium]